MAARPRLRRHPTRRHAARDARPSNATTIRTEVESRVAVEATVSTASHTVQRLQDASAKSCMDSDRAYQYELPMNKIDLCMHRSCEGAHFLYS